MVLVTDELSTALALAHLTRLRILDTLRIKPGGFDYLKDELNLAPGAVNFHLRTLITAKLVTEDETGYVLTDRGKDTFEALIKEAEERLGKKE